MQRISLICLSVCLLWISDAAAQKAPASGTLVSQSVTLTQDSVATTIFTTPKKGHFVLTQIGTSGTCSSPPIFTASDFGPLGTTQTQRNFNPALVVPSNSSIQCSGTSGCDCYMTGILEK
jgi:hypothetical protein